MHHPPICLLPLQKQLLPPGAPSFGLFTHPCHHCSPGRSLLAPSSAEALSGVLRQFQELPPVGSNGTLYPLLWQRSHCCNYHFHDTFFSHILMFTVPIPIMLMITLPILLSSKRHIFYHIWMFLKSGCFAAMCTFSVVGILIFFFWKVFILRMHLKIKEISSLSVCLISPLRYELWGAGSVFWSFLYLHPFPDCLLCSYFSVNVGEKEE